MYANWRLQCRIPATSLGICCMCSSSNWCACSVRTGYVFFGTLVFYLIERYSQCNYCNLEKFRVQKFSCNKFSCEKIFVRHATVRNLNARNIFLLDVYISEARWENLLYPRIPRVQRKVGRFCWRGTDVRERNSQYSRSVLLAMELQQIVVPWYQEVLDKAKSSWPRGFYHKYSSLFIFVCVKMLCV